MLVARSENRKPKATHATIANAIRDVSAKALREYVELLSFPRHYVVEKAANLRARDLLVRLLRSFGFAPVLQGAYDNIVATTGEGPYLLFCRPTHFRKATWPGILRP